MESREFIDIVCLGATLGWAVRLVAGLHIALDRAAALGILAVYLLRLGPDLETIAQNVPDQALNLVVALLLAGAVGRLRRELRRPTSHPTIRHYPKRRRATQLNAA